MLGGLGVAIVGDLFAKRRWVRLALETKLVVVMTVVPSSSAGCSRCSCSSGRTRRTLGALPPLQRPLNALFESIAFRSAGMTHDPDRPAHRLEPAGRASR